MSLLDKKDQEIFKIAEPIWDNLVKSSNMKDYGGFTKDFSARMLMGANEIEIGNKIEINNNNLGMKNLLSELGIFSIEK